MPASVYSQLRIDRGQPKRRYYWERRLGYQERLDAYKARLRLIRANPAAARKPTVTTVAYVRPGQSFRRVDGDGRAFGPRITAPTDLDLRTRVRLVDRQEEDLHSQLSRMLKAAHRAAVRQE